jgi:hypothetical protein
MGLGHRRLSRQSVLIDTRIVNGLAVSGPGRATTVFPVPARATPLSCRAVGWTSGIPYLPQSARLSVLPLMRN